MCRFETRCTNPSGFLFERQPLTRLRFAPARRGDDTTRRGAGAPSAHNTKNHEDHKDHKVGVEYQRLSPLTPTSATADVGRSEDERITSSRSTMGLLVIRSHS